MVHIYFIHNMVQIILWEDDFFLIFFLNSQMFSCNNIPKGIYFVKGCIFLVFFNFSNIPDSLSLSPCAY